MMQVVVDFERAEQLVWSLAAALGNRRVYGPDHRRAQDSLAHFIRSLNRFFESGGEQGFSLGVRGGQLTHEGIPLGQHARQVELAARLEGSRFSGVQFLPGVREDEVARLLDWLGGSSPATEPLTLETIALLRRAESERVAETEDEEDLPSQIAPFRLPLRIYRTAAGVLNRVFREAAAHGAPDFGEVSDLARWTAEEAFRVGTQLLGPIHLLKEDIYTYQHSVNVFMIATTLLHPLARDPDELARWARAALLHDIGKARIPVEILRKRGPLTENEFQIMQRHPELGAQILMETGEVDPIAIEVAYCHHMRDNGHGYPASRPGLRPGPVTNVVQVADMFEALTARRPYKAPHTIRQAVRIISETAGMGSKKQAVQLLVALFTEAPPGTECVLNTGERGVVLESRPDDPARPRVLLLVDANGEPLVHPQEVDLKAVGSGPDGTGQEVVHIYTRSETFATEVALEEA